MPAQKIQRIGIIGAGAWGTALANAAADSGRDVVLWASEAEVVAAKADGMSVVVAMQSRSTRQFILVSGLTIVGYSDSRDRAIARAEADGLVVVDRVRNRVVR